MALVFQPRFCITGAIASDLMRIEAVRQRAACLSLGRAARKALWEKTKGELVRYFRFIENLPAESNELEGYLEALQQVRSWISKKTPISVKQIQILHAYLLGEKAFRDGQNAVFNWNMTKILYLPPKAHEVPALMKQFVHWINHAHDLPCPLVAAVAHFGLNAIHPYYDGNGRSVRLLTRWILAIGGYDLGALYCLEKLYAEDLLRYYDALSLGDSKSYYQRVARRDLTPWIEYFCQILVRAFELSLRRMERLVHAS